MHMSVQVHDMQLHYTSYCAQTEVFAVASIIALLLVNDLARLV
jgi:hypothetical protein